MLSDLSHTDYADLCRYVAMPPDRLGYELDELRIQLFCPRLETTKSRRTKPLRRIPSKKEIQRRISLVELVSIVCGREGMPSEPPIDFKAIAAMGSGRETP